MSERRQLPRADICCRQSTPEDRNRMTHSDRIVESIAVRKLAALVAARQPGLPLRRRTVVEAFRNDIALHLLLQRVVADLFGGIQRAFHVALFQDALLPGVVRPDTGEAV